MNDIKTPASTKKEESINNIDNQITFEKFDQLKLKSFADNLFKNIEKTTSFSSEQQGAYTISLNADFGNGKTTFLKMFEKFVKEKTNYNVLFINAWKSDFHGKPVIAILSEFLYLIKNQDKKNKIKKLFKIIGNLSVNIFDQYIQSKTGISLCKAKDALTEKGEVIFENYVKKQNMIKEVNNFILEYTQERKLLIIIDELDRARPDYAVHFLEDIKHFFDVQNVVFLLAVNRNQMETTVKCLYGKDLNFNGYYRKFFKQEMDLPDPYKEAKNFINHLICKTKVQIDQDHCSDRIEHIYASCKIFNLTLREINIFGNIFKLILEHESKKMGWSYMDAYSFFICLLLKEKEYFNKILKNHCTVDNFLHFIDKKGFYPTEDYSNHYALWVVSCSFITRKSEEEDKVTVENEFSKSGQADDMLSRIKGGFNLDYGQPAQRICKNIAECKSAFQ